MAIRFRSAAAVVGLVLLAMGVFHGKATNASAQATNIVPTPGGVGTGGLGTVATQAGNTTNITGGLRPGNGPNVFHSFNQFSVGQGHTAAFINPGGASRVLARVIGGSPSNINGTIQALGWNLYFMNPSGIIFGPSAHLNVSGSAYFSTAQQLLLGDGKTFSTNLVALDATLSTAAPAAFGFVGSGAPAPIVISGSTLQVSDNTLFMAGGSVQLDGARISAQRTVVGAVGAGAQLNVDPGAGNSFNGSTPAGTLSASVGSSIQAGFSAEVFPATIVVPQGAQVNRTTGPFGFLTGVEVVAGPGGVPPGPNSGLPPVVFPAANTSTQAPVVTQNPVDPVVYLNRAATIFPQDAPAPPLALLTSRCAGGDKGEFSTFVQASRDITPPQPGNALASPFIWEEPAAHSRAVGSPLVAQRAESGGILSIDPAVRLSSGCGS
jgi:filamentous hemagglutinin family protein